MSAPNPLENTFIAVVEKLVAALFQGQSDVTDIKVQLDTHLEKAQKLGMLRYEAEALNALGIYSLLALGDWDGAMALFKASHAKAETSGDIGLQVKCLNNLGAMLNVVFDFDSSQGYFEQAVAYNTELTEPTNASAMLLVNLIGTELTHGNLAAVERYLHEALRVAPTIRVEHGQHNDYARTILHIRIASCRYHLLVHDVAKARAELNLVHEFSEAIRDEGGLYAAALCLVQLVESGSEAAFHEQWAGIPPDHPNRLSLLVDTSLMLHHLGYAALAHTRATEALALAENQANPRIFTNLTRLLGPLLRA